MELSEAQKKLMQASDEQLKQLESKYPKAVLRTRINKILASSLPKEQKKEQCRQLVLRIK